MSSCGLLGTLADSRCHIFNQASEIQGFDHAYVKAFLERASSVLRIAQTGQCDRDKSPTFFRWMLVHRLHQSESIPSGHRDVTYEHVWHLTTDLGQGFLRGLRSSSDRTKPPQKFRERLARIAMIFNDENPDPL